MLTETRDVARVVAALRPFSTQRIDRAILAWQTVSEVLRCLGASRQGVSYIVNIDGMPIAEECWDERQIRPGELITVRGVPTGGVEEGSSKDQLKQVAAVALTLGGIAIGGIGGAVFAAGTITLLNELVPTTPQDAFEGEDQPTVNLSNTLNPYGAVPRIYGTHRIYPPHATQWWYDGKEKCTHALYLVGHGPLEIDGASVKFGDRALDDIEHAIYEVRRAVDTEGERTIFPPLSAEVIFDYPLAPSVWSDPARTKDETDAIVVEARFPDGLFGEGALRRRFTVEVDFSFRVSLADQNDYHDATPDYGSTTVSGRDGRALSFAWRINLKGEPWGQPTSAQYDVQIKRGTATPTIGTGEDDATLATLTSIHWEDPIQMDDVASIGVRIYDTADESEQYNRLNVVASSILPIWTGAAWETYAAASTATSNPAAIVRDILMGSANDRALAASRIDDANLGEFYERCEDRAWEFNGVFDRQKTVYQAVNAVAQVGRATFAIRDGLFGVVMDRADATDTPVQAFTPLNSWDFKATKTFFEEIHGLKVQFINADAGWQHDEAIAYTEDYQSNPGDATRFEVVEAWGITNAEKARQYGRYLLEVAILRPEVYQLTTDMEHLVCTRGDLVQVTHDVALIGTGAGRIVAVYNNPSSQCIGVTVDERFIIPSGTLGVRIRVDNAGVLEFATRECLAYVADPQRSETSMTWEDDPITGTQPEIGDVVQFGELDEESAPMIITAIEPHDDLSATLTLVDHAPGVHTPGVWEEHESYINKPVEPEFWAPAVPNIIKVQSDESVLERGLDGSLVSRIAVTIQHPTGSDPLNHGAPVSYARPATVVLQWRVATANNPQAWDSAIFPGETLTLFATDVEDGETYDLRVRAISETNVASEWTDSVAHEVIGKLSPPPDPTGLSLEADVLRWTYEDPPLDLAGFVVRQHRGDSPSWDNAQTLHEGVIGDTIYALPNVYGGTCTFYVKAADTRWPNENCYSTNAAELTVTLPAMDLMNVDNNYSKDWKLWGYPPTYWLGAIITNGAVVGDEIRANATGSSPALFWDENPSARFWGESTDLFWPDPGGDQYEEMTVVKSGTFFYQSSAADLEFLVFHEYEATAGSHKIEYSMSGVGGPWLPWPGKQRWATESGGGGSFPSTIRITTSAGATQGVLQELATYIVYPDLIEHVIGHSITDTVSPERVPVSKAYTNIDVVIPQITAGTAIGWRIADKNATLGPRVFLYDSNGASVAGTIDVYIKGYRALAYP